MNEKMSEKIILDKMKQTLDYLYDMDMLHYILEDKMFYDIFSNLFPELSNKYLISIDQECEPFSEDSGEVKSMVPVEWFGEDHGLIIKDNQYFLIIRVTECGEKCYYIDRIDFNNLEMARKLVSIFEFLEDLNTLERVNRANIR